MVHKAHHSLREKIITPSTLKMEAGSSSETVVPVHQNTWHHMPSDYNLEVFNGCLLLFRWVAYQGAVMLHNLNWFYRDFR